MCRNCAINTLLQRPYMLFFILLIVPWVAFAGAEKGAALSAGSQENSSCFVYFDPKTNSYSVMDASQRSSLLTDADYLPPDKAAKCTTLAIKCAGLPRNIAQLTALTALSVSQLGCRREFLLQESALLGLQQLTKLILNGMESVSLANLAYLSECSTDAPAVSLKQLPALETLKLTNHMTSLIVQGCSVLKDIEGKVQGSVAMSDMPQLQTVNITGPLTVLDIKDCPELTSVGATRGGQKFASVIENCPQLKRFDLTANNLTECPSIPNTVTDLTLSQNAFTSLPALPKGLRILRVDSNALSVLEGELPEGLEELSASKNSLTRVDLSGALALKSVNLDDNTRLVRVTTLPPKLEEFSAQRCSLRGVVLPDSLRWALLQKNLLTSVPYPATPASHCDLNVCDNLIAKVPDEALLGLVGSNKISINMRNNPLSREALAALKEWKRFKDLNNFLVVDGARSYQALDDYIQQHQRVCINRLEAMLGAYGLRMCFTSRECNFLRRWFSCWPYRPRDGQVVNGSWPIVAYSTNQEGYIHLIDRFDRSAYYHPPCWANITLPTVPDFSSDRYSDYKRVVGQQLGLEPEE